MCVAVCKSATDHSPNASINKATNQIKCVQATTNLMKVLVAILHSPT